ncbi:MAG: hypothetical protein Fur0041_02990 [Bacteroidia bacterium]
MFLIFWAVAAVAQTQTDSLVSALQHAGNDTSRVKTLNMLGWQLRTSEPEKAYAYLKEAKTLAEELNYERGKATSWNHIGVYHYRKGNYVDAAKAHTQALAIRKRINDVPGIAKSYLNLGNVYSDQKNIRQALEYYKNAAAAFKQAGDESWMGQLYLNIGAMYIQEKNYSEAIDFCIEAKKTARKLKDKTLEAQALNNIGAARDGMNNRTAAYEAFMEAYNIAAEIGDKSLMADAGMNVGTQLRFQKKYAEALKWHRDAEQLCREIDYKEGLRNLYLEMANDFIDQKNFEKALFYHIRYKEISDSLFNEENMDRLNELTVRWQNEVRERKLAESERELAKRIEGEKRANQRMWFFASGTLLLLCFMLFVLYAYRRNQQASKLLALQKEEIEHKNSELALKNKDITDSIVYSRRIQTSMMPGPAKISSVFPDAFILYKPRDIVSGDFYWTEQQGDMRLFAAADCTGHGVPGALLSVVGINLLNQAVLVNGIDRPGAILNAVSAGMKKTLAQQQSDSMGMNDGMDIALIALNRKIGKLYYAGANNPLWILRGEELLVYKADKKTAGNYIIDDNGLFTEHEIEVRPGDVIYLFTDGYADQFGGPQGKKFKYKQLQEKLLQLRHLSIQEQESRLCSIFEDWKGNLEQIDDVLVAGIRV